jgi:hypothetical protein
MLVALCLFRSGGTVPMGESAFTLLVVPFNADRATAVHPILPTTIPAVHGWLAIGLMATGSLAIGRERGSTCRSTAGSSLWRRFSLGKEASRCSSMNLDYWHQTVRQHRRHFPRSHRTQYRRMRHLAAPLPPPDLPRVRVPLPDLLRPPLPIRDRQGVRCRSGRVAAATSSTRARASY